MKNKVTVADLKDLINAPYPRPFLLCRVCGEQNSADKGDYWNVPADHVFKHCGKPMVQVTAHTVYTRVA